jgi:2-polyprenyl-3-methyl-5-hydroxy-6-metoxy-1,4-benzoquinol methylase
MAYKRYISLVHSLISKLVDTEIRELIQKGWSDFPSQIDGLRIVVQVEESEVSFPRESYDIERGNQEASGVWANWRARKILKVMKQNELKLLWEVGSGHGNVAIPLQREDMAVIGIEPLFSGAAITAKNGVRTYQGTLESLKLPSNSLYAIGVFDVLEHLEKPEVLLSEIYRTLKPGGVLLVSVPAHQWLFSDFDKSIGHYRRYSREVLSQQLKRWSLCSQYLFYQLLY